jgi:hypothetical protein
MELCVRRSKNISELNGIGVACLPQQMQPDRQAHGGQTGQKPWRQESPFTFSPGA